MKTRRIVYQRKNTRIGSSFLVFHYPFVLLFHKQERNLKRVVPFMIPRKRKKRKEKGMLFPSFVKVGPNFFGFQEFFFLIRKKSNVDIIFTDLVPNASLPSLRPPSVQLSNCSSCLQGHLGAQQNSPSVLAPQVETHGRK